MLEAQAFVVTPSLALGSTDSPDCLLILGSPLLLGRAQAFQIPFFPSPITTSFIEFLMDKSHMLFFLEWDLSLCPHLEVHPANPPSGWSATCLWVLESFFGGSSRECSFSYTLANGWYSSGVTKCATLEWMHLEELGRRGTPSLPARSLALILSINGVSDTAARWPL